MVLTNDDAVAGRVRLPRSHGMTTLTWDRHRGRASARDAVALGYNHRIDEPRSTLGRLRLGRIDDAFAPRCPRRKVRTCRYPIRTALALVTLPLFAHIDEEEVDAVLGAVRRAIVTPSVRLAR
jgi:dTDP-4-amino-4,6-dideoxygalactose transaminase